MTATAESAEPIVDTVIALVRETLAAGDEQPIAADSLLFRDLDFTSMDLLDLIFRLEERFAVRIPEGTLASLARGPLTAEEFAGPTALTPLGRERLMALLADTPRALFPAEIHPQTLPRYCTVGAFARLVEHLRTA